LHFLFIQISFDLTSSESISILHVRGADIIMRLIGLVSDTRPQFIRYLINRQLFEPLYNAFAY
jgi:hypothetical protein